jgi:hypothetical protein
MARESLNVIRRHLYAWCEQCHHNAVVPITLAVERFGGDTAVPDSAAAIVLHRADVECTAGVLSLRSIIKGNMARSTGDMPPG